jgi:hypothetical protein
MAQIFQQGPSSSRLQSLSNVELDSRLPFHVLRQTIDVAKVLSVLNHVGQLSCRRSVWVRRKDTRRALRATDEFQGNDSLGGETMIQRAR